MRWLVGYTLASMAIAFVAVRVFEYLFAGATSGFVVIAKPAVFAASWTAVTAQAGMQRVTSQARSWRRRSADIREALTRGEE